MADDKQVQTQAEKPADATYPRARLIAESGTLFGQPSHVVVGALSQGRLATKENFTVAEAKKAVQDFLDHEVEIDHPSPEREE